MIDNSLDEQVLAVSNPESSFITLYPVDERQASAEDVLLRLYQVGTVGALEDFLHGLIASSSGVRNIRLLEKQRFTEYSRFPEKPLRTVKRQIVQCELAAQQLYQGMANLIETHDKFQISRVLSRDGDSEGRLDAFASDLLDVMGDLIEPLNQEFGWSRSEVEALVAEQTTSADHRDVNAAMLDELEWLYDESGSPFLPRICVMTALDTPYFVEPVSEEGGQSVPAEEIDFTGRFMAIMDVLRIETVIKEIRRCSGVDEMIPVVIDAVEEYSAIDTPKGTSAVTPRNVDLPLIDTVREWSQTVSEQPIDPENLILDSSYSDRYEKFICFLLEFMCETYGGIAIGDQFLLRNPYTYDLQVNGRIYGEYWDNEFIYGSLFQQLLRRTVHREDIPIQNPFDIYDNCFPDAPPRAEEYTTGFANVVDDFAAIEVEEEAELRK